MPIYPYACRLCGHRFDVVKRMAKASDPEACRECEAPDAQRTYQPLGITGGCLLREGGLGAGL
jgi:putative FmdB family regulatory protein